MVETLRIFFDSLGVDWVLWLLLGLSVVSIGIMIERWIFFSTNSSDVLRLDEILQTMIAGDDPKGALRMLGQLKGLEAVVLADGVRALEKGAGAVEEIIDAAVARERVRYERYLPFLGTLGNNAPFIGLFGTVLGIISAFADLSASVAGADASRKAALMTSIAEALVATAVGLLVAIPAVIAFNQFKGKIKERSSHAESLSRLLLAHLKDESQKPKKAA
jgi:biopolymer transport protein ExbB